LDILEQLKAIASQFSILSIRFKTNHDMFLIDASYSYDHEKNNCISLSLKIDRVDGGVNSNNHYFWPMHLVINQLSAECRYTELNTVLIGLCVNDRCPDSDLFFMSVLSQFKKFEFVQAIAFRDAIKDVKFFVFKNLLEEPVVRTELNLTKDSLKETALQLEAALDNFGQECKFADSY
jgi:hypothetical protein